MEVHPHPMRMASLSTALARQFNHMAAEKGVALDLSLDPATPEVLVQDQPKLAQIFGQPDLERDQIYRPRGRGEGAVRRRR